MEVENSIACSPSPPLSVSTTTTAATTSDEDEQQQQHHHHAKSYLEETPRLHTHPQVMTVDIDISDNRADDNNVTLKSTSAKRDNKTSGVGGSGGDDGADHVVQSNRNSVILNSKSGHTNISSIGGGGGGSSLPGNFSSHNSHTHQSLLNQVLNGNLRNSSELKRIQRIAVSEERLTSAWRKSNIEKNCVNSSHLS